MSQAISAIRGMHDVLPEHIAAWQHVETQLRALMQQYGYSEIRLPIVEKTPLFSRAIGEVTDIVDKEMYTFIDRSDDSLSLRPEGTAGCVRSVVEHSLAYGQVQRLWYLGPMFRRERPQKGRYRQFYQFGAEVYGLAEPLIDAEMIIMTARLWRSLGLLDGLTLHINSLGNADTRAAHREALVAYFEQHQDQLDEDSLKRLHKNPLRILDSKNPDMQTLIEQAPLLSDYFDEATQKTFDDTLALLKAAGVAFHINPRLVRGLDYYSHVVYEWVSDALGAQGTVCGGGRYDALVPRLGGKETPAVGFALGMERLVMLLEAQAIASTTAADGIFVISMGEAAEHAAVVLCEQLRDAWPKRCVQFSALRGSFKKQFKQADKSGAAMALILGEDEVAQNTVTVKFLRDSDAKQQTVSRAELLTFVTDKLGEST